MSQPTSPLAHLTRALYRAARISNKVRMYAQAADGHPRHLITHLKNRVLFHVFGRALK
jgi:hypothetical protein